MTIFALRSLIVILAIGGTSASPRPTSAATLESYVQQDNELYSNIKNAEALDFLKRNIPQFECPDEEIERAYYFR